MRSQIRCAMTVAAVSIACLFSATVRGADPATNVQQALNDLQTWLGSGATGQGWSTFLALGPLKTELAKGDQADPQRAGAADAIEGDFVGRLRLRR